jgi:AbiV family abortive infection protein
MRPRAIKDLAQLGDAELFTELGKGMRLCLGNALQLWGDARRLLAVNRPQGYSILQLFVEEEAAKFHILLDAVRCPRQPADVFARQLGYFNQHLAKGLYALYYNIFSPADLPEIRRHMDRERRALYLDGPNDVDWVFRNDILRKREEAVYVDYVAHSNSGTDEHYWHYPDPRRLRIGMWDRRPKVLDVALALHGVGITTESGLAITADLWRNAAMDDSVKWPTIRALNVRTIEALENARLLRTRPDATYRLVANDWLFPLFPVDLRELGVDARDLQ